MKVVFSKHYYPEEFSVETKGVVKVSEVGSRNWGLSIEHADGSVLTISETPDGFAVNHRGSRGDDGDGGDRVMFDCGITTFKSNWPDPPVTEPVDEDALKDAIKGHPANG